MKRSMWMLPVALLLVAGTQVYSAEPPGGQEARKNARPKPGVKIAKLILQLDSDEFKVREQATQALTKAGLKALPAVLKAIESKQPEVRSRAFAILFAMSKSDDRATANAALAAAKVILKSPDRHRVAQAKKILKKFHEWEIQGKWIVVETYRKGKKLGGEEVGEVFTFSGKKTIISPADGGKTGEWEGSFGLRPDKKPRELDLVFTYPIAEMTLACIYEISGNTLRICMTESDEEVRPDAVGHSAEDDRRLWVLKRVKGDDKK